MNRVTLTKEEARSEYGQAFVDYIMKGRDQIELTAGHRVLLEKWLLIKKLKFAPFAYEYIYMVENGQNEFKVGITRAPRSRLQGLQTSNSGGLQIHGLMIIGGQVGRNVERALHVELKRQDRHLRGEWFAGKPSVLWPIIVDFAKAQYGRHFVNLSDAWEGSEPLVGLYLASTMGSPIAADVVKCRQQFLWVVSEAEKGLTIAA